MIHHKIGKHAQTLKIYLHLIGFVIILAINLLIQLKLFKI